MHRKTPWRSKGSRCHLIVSDVNHPLSSSLESILAQREVHPHGDLNHFHGTFLPGFLWSIISIWLALSLYLIYLSKLPCVHTCSLLASKEGATLSEPAHVFIHIYSLSSKKHLTCFTTFYLSVETDFCTADGPRALLLAPGGRVVRIQVSLCCSTSISGQKLKSSLEPLQVKARGDHYQLAPAYYTPALALSTWRRILCASARLNYL